MRPSLTIRFRDEAQFDRIRELAKQGKISLNAFILAALDRLDAEGAAIEVRRESERERILEKIKELVA